MKKRKKAIDSKTFATAKMWSNFADLGKHQNIPILWHVLDVFSQQVGPIELIPFALGKASPDKSLEYPQPNIPITLKFPFILDLTPLVGYLTIFFQ